MPDHVLERDNTDLFARLRNLSSSPPTGSRSQPDAADKVAELRRSIRAPLMLYLRAAHEIYERWRVDRSEAKGLRFVDASEKTQCVTRPMLPNLFHVPRDDFFFNASQALLASWDAALVDASAQPALSDAISTINAALTALGLRGDLSPRPVLHRTRGTVFLRTAAGAYSRESAWRQKHYTARNLVWLELVPACNLWMGFVYVAAAKLNWVSDPERLSRIVLNSKPFLEHWATLSQGAFVALRTVSVNSKNAMLEPRPFTLLYPNTPEEQLVFSAESIALIDRCISRTSEAHVRYRHNCPGLQIRGATTHDSSVVGGLDHALALYVAQSPRIRR
ncbi:MAG: hypothetical protein U0136_00770 [Bdellovibrionota bacterium]